MNGRRARARRKERRQAAAERALLPREHGEALADARKKRDRELGLLATETDKKIRALLVEDAQERRKIWASYDERRDALLKGKPRSRAKAKAEAEVAPA